MKDRIPTKKLENGAIRYGIYGEDGGLIRYEYIKLEDEPSEQGTALNKANLLSDETATSLALEQEDPTVNDALVECPHLIKSDTSTFKVSVLSTQKDTFLQISDTIPLPSYFSTVSGTDKAFRNGDEIIYASNKTLARFNTKTLETYSVTKNWPNDSSITIIGIDDYIWIWNNVYVLKLDKTNFDILAQSTFIPNTASFMSSAYIYCPYSSGKYLYTTRVRKSDMLYEDSEAILVYNSAFNFLGYDSTYIYYLERPNPTPSSTTITKKKEDFSSLSRTDVNTMYYEFSYQDGNDIYVLGKTASTEDNHKFVKYSISTNSVVTLSTPTFNVTKFADIGKDGNKIIVCNNTDTTIRSIPNFSVEKTYTSIKAENSPFFVSEDPTEIKLGYVKLNDTTSATLGVIGEKVLEIGGSII